MARDVLQAVFYLEAFANLVSGIMYITQPKMMLEPYLRSDVDVVDLTECLSQWWGALLIAQGILLLRGTTGASLAAVSSRPTIYWSLLTGSCSCGKRVVREVLL